MSDIIFENYYNFVQENESDFTTPQGVVSLLNDKAYFESFVDALTEGLDADAVSGIRTVLDRYRVDLLTEAANVPASGFAQGWTVMSFPILVDIYANEIHSKVCTIYPTNAGQISISRLKVKAKITSYDGNTTTEYDMNTMDDVVRAPIVEVNVVPNTKTNLFTAAGVSIDEFRLNRRYTLVAKAVIVGNDGSSDHDITVTFNVRPDNRDQFRVEFEATQADDGTDIGTLKGYIYGNINYQSGEAIYSETLDTSDAASGWTFTFDHTTLNIRFLPYKTMKGRAIVTVTSENYDYSIDPGEDFVLDLTEEDIQDYKSIFKVDLIQTISDAIKKRILLNTDYDLGYFLQATESQIMALGAKATVNLDTYATANSGNYAPASVLDVLKAVVPRIAYVSSKVKKNFQEEPNVIVTGSQTAALLKSLQDFAIQMKNGEGNLGFTGSIATFLKMNVVESYYIPTNKIYMIPKPTNGRLNRSVIVNLVYKPIYLKTEVDNGRTINYVRSRTLLDVLRPDGVGCIELQNLNKYVA
jgi:hypothetical protein